MAICWFANDTSRRYRCEFSVDTEKIKVDIEYDIKLEISKRNGVVTWPPDQINERDIHLYDSESKLAYLIKDAFFFGANFRYNSFDNKEISTFISYTYFTTNQPSQIENLPSTPKIKKLKIFSKSISEYIGHPSTVINDTDEECSVSLSRKNHERNIEIGSNNIKQITISDSWSITTENHSISIEMTGS